MVRLVLMGLIACCVASMHCVAQPGGANVKIVETCSGPPPLPVRMDSINLEDRVIPSSVEEPAQQGQGLIFDDYGEAQAEFPGDIRKYLAEHLRYPSSPSVEDAPDGKILVRFTIEEDGHVCDAIILKSSHTFMNNEVLRVINEMPNWKPGKWNGKPVSTQYQLPVRLRFDVD